MLHTIEPESSPQFYKAEEDSMASAEDGPIIAIVQDHSAGEGLKSNSQGIQQSRSKWAKIIIFLQIGLIIFLFLLYFSNGRDQTLNEQTKEVLETAKINKTTPDLGGNSSHNIDQINKKGSEGSKLSSVTSEQKTQKINTDVKQQKLQNTEEKSKAENEEKNRESKILWPTQWSDYNMSDSFNLWDMSPQDKLTLLGRYKEIPETRRPKIGENYSEINYDNEDFLKHAKNFESESEVINWGAIELSDAEKTAISKEFEDNRRQRRQRLQHFIDRQKTLKKGKVGMIDSRRQITYQQFADSLDYERLMGQNFKEDNNLKEIYEREKEYYEKKYKVSSYEKQLHACIVSPTYKNNVNYRYAWHIQSIMQQDYSNFRVIIVDDASPDNTGGVLAKYLKWRDFPRDKIVLIRNKVHKTAMENFYYAVHKYCDFNQMFFVVDGDDELSGTQVFRLYNALYQSKKFYVLYSNYISQDSSNSVSLGISQPYDTPTIKGSSYRQANHLYSHLRSTITDVFLLVRDSSFKDSNGKFYWAIPDDAQYFPALEMSCGRVEYIPELEYWYSANNGNNEWRSPLNERDKVFWHIKRDQKHYHCINNVFEIVKATLRSENKLL